MIKGNLAAALQFSTDKHSCLCLHNSCLQLLIAGLAAIKEQYLRSAEDLQRERAQRDAKEQQLLEQANATAIANSSAGSLKAVGGIKAVVAKRGQNKKRPRDEEQVRTTNYVYIYIYICIYILFVHI
jgi:hypothetical protein